jgi:molybdopterin synthase catalytic subunit
MKMECVTELPINTDGLYEKIRRSKSGSVVFHYAVVRMSTGDKVTASICYERNGDIESELAGLAAEIRSRWPTDDVLLVRRLGTLGIGEVISLVAISSPRSKDAFEACQFGVERIKTLTTLRKCEVFKEDIRA